MTIPSGIEIPGTTTLAASVRKFSAGVVNPTGETGTLTASVVDPALRVELGARPRLTRPEWSPERARPSRHRRTLHW